VSTPGPHEQVRSAIATLHAVVDGLDCRELDGPGARTLLDLFKTVVRLGTAGTAFAAVRVDETRAYRESGHKTAGDYLAARTGTSASAAYGLIATAQALDELPTTNEAFRTGALSEAQARAVSSTARLAPHAEAELLHTAATSTLKGLRERCARVRAAAEPDDTDWARRIYESRFHRRWTSADGAACGEYRLAPEKAAKFWAALDAHQDRIFRAARAKGLRESSEAYAADALVILAEDGPCKPIETRLLADATAIERGNVEPGERCEILGVGPVSVTAARALLTDARVVTMLREGDEIAAISSPNRTIPAALRRWLETNYPTCGVKGCDVDHGLEIDHVVDYAEVRETTRDNTWRVCPNHHDLKTYFGWKVIGAPGTWELVPPEGANGDPDPPP
jgi:hypothetical protein